ncbi:IS1096 element passenger TnpR family protein [Microbacterium phosphatis]|uniref:IS1096 element passenger TnpR family protein n=1 Tax=Microbacterium phosphatis TaxID=3140248 RepID=UPI003140C3B5
MIDPEDVDARFAALVADATLDHPVTPPIRSAAPRGARILVVRAAHDEVWREIEMRSDLTLDIVHEILQVAFAWPDLHPHLFESGEQLYIVDDEVEHLGGLSERRMHLGAVLTAAGDQLQYRYEDDVILTLVGAHPATDEDPAVLVTSASDADLGAINEAFRSELFSLLLAGVDSRLINMVDRLHETELGHRLAWRLADLLVDRPELTADERAQALTPYRWFLERAGTEGIELTAAGYLKPSFVQEAAAILPSMRTWSFGIHREADVHPVLFFRQEMQRIGLLRKHRGRLLRTRKGAAALRDPDRLWTAVTDSASAYRLDGYPADEVLLTLLHAATTHGTPIDRSAIAGTLTELGWRLADGRPPQSHLVGLPSHLPMFVLRELGEVTSTASSKLVMSPAARALARDALIAPQ